MKKALLIILLLLYSSVGFTDQPWRNWKPPQKIERHYVYVEGKVLEDEWGQPLWYGSQKEADKAKKRYLNRKEIRRLEEKIRQLSE